MILFVHATQGIVVVNIRLGQHARLFIFATALASAWAHPHSPVSFVHAWFGRPAAGPLYPIAHIASQSTEKTIAPCCCLLHVERLASRSPKFVKTSSFFM